MKNSLEKNKIGILLMLCSSITVCAGQLLWKLFTINQSLTWLIIGFFLYGIGALFMITAYRFGSLSVLQPILSINYVFTLVLGAWILNESFSIIKVLGTIVIMIGVILIGGGDTKE